MLGSWYSFFLRLWAFRFLNFFFFFFLFSPFLFFLLQWVAFYLACQCLQLKSFSESVIETGKFYHGIAMCSGRKFCSEFFTKLFEHFCAYLRLHSGDHSDLVIIGKIFSSCRSWVYKWWRQKWKKSQGLSRSVTVGTGVNGLNNCLRYRPLANLELLQIIILIFNWQNIFHLALIYAIFYFQIKPM